jgi:hypothetical protein
LHPQQSGLVLGMAERAAGVYRDIRLEVDAELPHEETRGGTRGPPAQSDVTPFRAKSKPRSRQLTRVLPGWLAGESTFTALLPHRLGLLPAVRIFVD